MPTDTSQKAGNEAAEIRFDISMIRVTFCHGGTWKLWYSVSECKNE
jgi:hypothetical protein